MPIDHFSLQVPLSHLESIVTFLTTSLSHIGFKEFYRPVPTCVGMGDGRPYLWIVGVEETDAGGTKGECLGVLLREKNTHMAFGVDQAHQVREFHQKALAAGGVDNGAPGLRPHFGPDYYAAFVKDPVCGINFEVICRGGDN